VNIDTSRTTPSGLHPRLTVVLVPGAPADAHELATRLVEEPIDAALVAAAAQERAAADEALRTRHREAAIARLVAERDMAADLRDAADATVAALGRRRAQVVDGARWCEEEGTTVASLAATLHSAEETLVGAREQAARALARLGHVQEQRAAATTVLEEGRAELLALESAHLAEPALRRELEQAVRELQDAERDMTAANQRRTAAEAAIRAAEEAEAEIDGDLASLPAADPGAVEALRTALETVTAILAGPPDPAALALERAIAAAGAALARMDASVTVPEPGAVEAAERQRADAERRLVEAKAEAQVRRQPPGWWQELGDLHEVVVDAEAKAKGRSGRQRYEVALAAERALLDELGFDSYMDALLSGGRLPNKSAAAASGSVLAAEAEVTDAGTRVAEAREQARIAAPFIGALAERDRLVAEAAALVDADPSDDLLARLRTHRSVPPAAQDALTAALTAVGVPAPIDAPVEAARSWLARYDATADPARLTELESAREDLAAERARLVAEVAHASNQLAALDETAATARRSVARFEAELHSRVHDYDADPTQRAVSAAALRDRITTLEAQLHDAAVRAERDVAETAATAEVATAERDRTRSALLALARHAGKLADEIALERRPAFDALANVGALGGALRAEAQIIEAEIADAELRLAQAAQELLDATTGLERYQTLPVAGAPTIDDAIAALDDLLAGRRSDVVTVVVDPLIPEVEVATAELLETILLASADHPVLLVTTDHETVAWAIELPGEQGAVVPLRALVPDDRSLSPR
jgi:hypothetical protein